MISHLITTPSLHSIVVSIPDFHPGGRGSIPHGSKLVQIFIHFFQKIQTLRAKISPFPWEKSGNIFISHSHEPKDRFKAIKFMVGHFGWEHFVCVPGIHSVNMKLSICLDNTRKISKFPPWGSGERKGDYLQTFRTFSKKISNIVSKIEIFFEKVRKVCKNRLPFPAFPTERIWKFFLYSLFTYLSSCSSQKITVLDFSMGTWWTIFSPLLC